MEHFADDLYTSAPSLSSTCDIITSQAPLREYEEKLRFAKTKYEQRIHDLTEQVRRMHRDLLKDDVLSAMKENPVSKQFAGQRARELLEGSLMKEKEATIAKLQAEIIEIKGSAFKVEQDHARLMQSHRRLETVCSQELDERQELERELLDIRAKLKQQTLALEESFKRKEMEALRQADEGATTQRRKHEELLNGREAEIKRLVKELEREQCKTKKLETELDSVDFNTLKRQLVKLRDENEALRTALQKTDADRQGLKEEYLTYSREVEQALSSTQRTSSETVDLLQHKFKAKARQFKKKITEQKAAIEGLQQQNKANHHSLDEQKRYYEKLLHALQEDLRKVRDEWKRKCHGMELEAQRREAEIVSKHQLQAASLQGHYQSLLEQRLSELRTELMLGRNKAQDTEIRAAYDDKIREVERDYITLAKHESQLALIKGQLEEETAKVSAAQGELRAFKAKLQDSLDIGVHLRNDLEVEKSTSKALHEQLSKLHAELDVSLLNKRNLLQQLEASSDNISKLKALLEDEKRRRNDSETEKASLSEQLIALQGQLSEKHNSLQRNRAQLEETLKRLRDEQEVSVQNESFKVQQVSFELAEAREEMSRYKSERENLDKELRDLQTALNTSAREVRQVRLAESQKYEEELSRHIETKGKLLAAEAKAKHLQSEVQDFEGRVADLRATLRSNDQELLTLRNKLHELDSSLTIGNADRRDLQRRFDRQKNSTVELKQRLHSMVSHRLLGFKNELSSLKTLAEGELKLCKKETNSLMQDLHFTLLEKLSFLRRSYDTKLQETTDQLNSDWNTRLNEVTDEITGANSVTTQTLQEKVVDQERVLVQLKDALAKAETERGAVQDSADQQAHRLQILEIENAGLKSELKRNSENFDSLQLEVSEQTSRIKTDSNALLDKVRRDLLSKHHAELATVSKQLEDLQLTHYKALDRLEQDATQLKSQFTNEALSKLAQMEAKLSDRDNKLKIEKETTEDLKRQMKDLELQTDALQQLHNQALNTFEGQVAKLEAALRIEQDNQVKLRLDKTNELEQLARQLRETSREVDSRSYQLSNIERENFELKDRLSELERDLSAQAQANSQSNALKERELMNLRELLTKSYTETLDPVRRARELDRETQELTKQILRGPKSRRDTTELKS